MAAATAEVEQRATSAEERLVGCGMYHQYPASHGIMARKKLAELVASNYPERTC